MKTSEDQIRESKKERLQKFLKTKSKFDQLLNEMKELRITGTDPKPQNDMGNPSSKNHCVAPDDTNLQEDQVRVSGDFVVEPDTEEHSTMRQKIIDTNIEESNNTFLSFLVGESFSNPLDFCSDLISSIKISNLMKFTNQVDILLFAYGTHVINKFNSSEESIDLPSFLNLISSLLLTQGIRDILPIIEEILDSQFLKNLFTDQKDSTVLNLSRTIPNNVNEEQEEGLLGDNGECTNHDSL